MAPIIRIPSTMVRAVRMASRVLYQSTRSPPNHVIMNPAITPPWLTHTASLSSASTVSMAFRFRAVVWGALSPLGQGRCSLSVIQCWKAGSSFICS